MIYQTRPQVCRDYNCLWLRNPRVPDDWYPLRAKMVLSLHEDGTALPVLRVHIHPRYPERWREEPYRSGLRKLAAWGLDNAPHYKTVIVRGREWLWLILRDREVPLTKKAVA